MKNLLYKEFRLFWHPAMFLFLLFGTFLLIPSWPYFIAFGYIFIAFNTAFIASRGNQDILLTVSFPVRKRDTVLAKVYLIVIVELLQVVISIPFALINNAIYKGNMAGMNVNFAFYGLVLIMYALFNIIFLPMFYKTAYKVGVPVIVAILAVLVYIGVVNFAVLSIPYLKTNLNGLGVSHLGSQLLVLAAGIILFLGTTPLVYRMSAQKFEKVDL
ncbi:MAG: ABC-2 transporter permease [Bacillota bacterium]|nr:ABC-2 transporter permease [Bacillota bacterium]